MCIRDRSYTVINDVISQLGLSQKFAQEHILKNLVGDFRNQPIDEDAYKDDGSVRFQLKSFKLPKMSNLTSIDKKTVTQELCQYVKNYVNSQEFIDEYRKLRERAKPTSEPYRTVSYTHLDVYKRQIPRNGFGLASLSCLQ